MNASVITKWVWRKGQNSWIAALFDQMALVYRKDCCFGLRILHLERSCQWYKMHKLQTSKLGTISIGLWEGEMCSSIRRWCWMATASGKLLMIAIQRDMLRLALRRNAVQITGRIECLPSCWKWQSYFAFWETKKRKKFQDWFVDSVSDYPQAKYIWYLTQCHTYCWCSPGEHWCKEWYAKHIATVDILDWTTMMNSANWLFRHDGCTSNGNIITF